MQQGSAHYHDNAIKHSAAGRCQQGEEPFKTADMTGTLLCYVYVNNLMCVNSTCKLCVRVCESFLFIFSC